MTTIDELREVLEHRAGVPDPTGLIEAARARARQVRRRRRMIAAATVVAVVAVAVPVTVARLRTPDPLPAAPAPYRGPDELTVTIGPEAGYYVADGRIDATAQRVFVGHRDGVKRADGGTVTVYNPGTYDPAWLETGERITVRGRPAFRTPTFLRLPTQPPFAPSVLRAVEHNRWREQGVAAIGWLDPSGAWVVVSGTRSQSAVLKVAESVRLGPPRRVTSPMRFGRVPNGLRLDFVENFGDPEGPPTRAGYTAVGFTAEPASTPGPSALSATIQQRTERGWQELTRSTPSQRWQTIGGHRARYLPPGSPPVGGTKGNLLIEAGRCGVQISFRPEQVGYDELVRTVTGMTFADCTDPTTWTPPVS